MNPQCVAEWLQLVRQHEISARALCEDREAAAMAYGHVGFAVEAALKAYIMRREGLNRWPDKDERAELWTHDLRRLVAIAGISLDVRAQTGPSWSVVLQWDRSQGYDPMYGPAAFRKLNDVLEIRSRFYVSGLLVGV